VVNRSDAPSAALTALEQENQRLRDVCRELSHNSAVAAEIEGLRNQLQDAFKVQDELRSELRRVLDDRDRERIEHEAALAALRSEMTIDLIKHQEEQVEAAAQAAQATAAALPSALLEADERIRAFRQHLKEIHEVEAEQRMKRTLAARLSRLWRHTGPNP
jgi:chromosome segregation ATPase